MPSEVNVEWSSVPDGAWSRPPGRHLCLPNASSQGSQSTVHLESTCSCLVAWCPRPHITPRGPASEGTQRSMRSTVVVGPTVM